MYVSRQQAVHGLAKIIKHLTIKFYNDVEEANDVVEKPGKYLKHRNVESEGQKQANAEKLCPEAHNIQAFLSKTQDTAQSRQTQVVRKA